MTRASRWRVIAVAALAVGATLTFPTTGDAATGDATKWTSFYESGPLKGVGWAACPEPIRVSLDTPLYTGETVNRFVTALTNAVVLWSKSSGLTFIYDGKIPVTFDDSTGVTSPADGVNRPRHIYFAVIPDKDSGLLDREVVGLGVPTFVDTANREITQADVTFEYEYVKASSTAELTALFTHEFGHALGLGHSKSKADVMYPYVSKAEKLGPGDLAGIRAITRPCSAATPSRDYPLPG